MGKCIIMSQGVGVNTDVLSANKDDVLKGKTAITHDSNGNPMEGTLQLSGNANDSQVLSGSTYYNTDPKVKRTGTIPTRGVYTSLPNADDCGRDNTGFYNRIPYGYYPERGAKKGFAYNYIPDSVLASAIGLTQYHLIKGSHILGIRGDPAVVNTSDANVTSNKMLTGASGYANGAKVSGNIPIQNPDVPGTTDRISATNKSCWDGTICLGVRNGRYLNGVNWVQFNDPNFKASNFKKGVPIMGLIGTFEGYVPTATDLYNNGYNAGVFGNPASYSKNNAQYESNMILIAYRNTLETSLRTNKMWNLSGFSRLNIDINITSRYEYTPSLCRISFVVGSSIYDNMRYIGGDDTKISEVSNLSLGRRTISLPFSGMSYTKYLHINLYEIGGYVYRIWLS